MQISTSNLLASQSQPPRSRSSEGFEPIDFKSAPAASAATTTAATTTVAATTAAPSATAASAASAPPSAATSASASTGYVRPGSQIDIKI
jgi:hypothetical protein